jgi:hypothetical protein
MVAQREQLALAVVSFGLMAWGSYLIYDMNQLKQTPEFKAKFEHVASQSGPDQGHEKHH